MNECALGIQVLKCYVMSFSFSIFTATEWDFVPIYLLHCKFILDFFGWFHLSSKFVSLASLLSNLFAQKSRSIGLLSSIRSIWILNALALSIHSLNQAVGYIVVNKILLLYLIFILNFTLKNVQRRIFALRNYYVTAHTILLAENFNFPFHLKE